MFTGAATAIRAVDRGEQERLGPAARLAGGADRVAAHVGQRFQEVERRGCCSTAAARRGSGPTGLTPAAEGVRQLAAVVVADHVVGEHHEALARQADGAPRYRS